MRKKLLIIISSLIIVLMIIILCLWYFNSKTIFQRKFKFALPKTAEIMDKSYSIYYDCLEMKVQFGVKDYKTIVEGIDTYAKDNVPKVNVKKEEDMNFFPVYCKFWNEREEKELFGYRAYKQDRWGLKTRMVYILITKNQKNEDQYFLHIYY